jgi:hypothetical protein
MRCTSTIRACGHELLDHPEGEPWERNRSTALCRRVSSADERNVTYPRARIGWGDRYEGESLVGNFKERLESDSWYERFNFMATPHNRCYGYIVPTPVFPPHPSVLEDWLVIFCSVSLAHHRLVPVGWYERATLAEAYSYRPEHATLEQSLMEWWEEVEFNVTTTTDDAYWIPVANRHLFPDVPSTQFKRSFIYARLMMRRQEMSLRVWLRLSLGSSIWQRQFQPSRRSR